MRTKLSLLVGAGIGYVLGTRAGHERYEQIKAQATRLWHDDRVQDKVGDVSDTVKAKAPGVQEKLGQAVGSATSAAHSKLGHADEDVAGQHRDPGTNSHPNVQPG